MGSHSSKPDGINVTDGGKNIGEIHTPSGLMNLLQAIPKTDPCSPLNGADVVDKFLTKAIVEDQYPAFHWDSARTWTPTEMECWAWLATRSGEAHPSREFSQDYGFEPYLLQL